VSLVSILITSYQRSHLLKWNLYSLLHQDIPFPFEVIVLNDGLPDDTENLCRQFNRTLNLKYVFTGQRNQPEKMIYRVPGFALNIGARLSQGDVLIISCAEMFHLNETIRFLTVPVRINSKLLATSVGMDDQDGSFLKYVNQHKGNFDQTAYNHNLPKLNTRLPFLMAINRDEFFNIGGYDEDFTGLAFDDNDLVDRLVNNGCELCMTQAQTVHLYHPRYDTGKDQVDDYIYNKNLYQQRKGKVIRNQGKPWGKILTG